MTPLPVGRWHSTKVGHDSLSVEGEHSTKVGYDPLPLEEELSWAMTPLPMGRDFGEGNR